MEKSFVWYNLQSWRRSLFYARDTYRPHQFECLLGNFWVRPPHLCPPASTACSPTISATRQWQTLAHWDSLSQWPWLRCPIWFLARRKSCSRQSRRSAYFLAGAPKQPLAKLKIQDRLGPAGVGLRVLQRGDGVRWGPFRRQHGTPRQHFMWRARLEKLNVKSKDNFINCS